MSFTSQVFLTSLLFILVGLLVMQLGQHNHLRLVEYIGLNIIILSGTGFVFGLLLLIWR